MPEALDSLRQAASTLLAAAPPAAVISAMHALLSGWELPAASVAPPLAARSTGGSAAAPAPTTPPAALARPRADPDTAPNTAASAPDTERAAWEALRQQVRAMLPTRGVTVQALADEFGMARSTVQTALQTRAPPSRALQQRLADWLAAPEVAAEASPFRGNATSRGHTAGRGATARNGAGAGTDRHEA
jgi:hypothetical protein